MKKKILCVLVFTVQTFFAQIISKDPAFASNGIYNIPVGSSYLGELTETSNAVFYQSFNSNTNQITISKNTSYNGSLDLSFGTNGKVTFNNYAQGSLVGFIRHTNDKLTLLLNRYDSTSNTNYLDVIRLLSNGQPDISFANGGIKIFTNLFQNNFDLKRNLIEQGNKILVSGVGVDPITGFFDYNTHTFRLNSDGTLDNSFANNGELLSYGLPNILLDNQSNIIVMGNYTIKKYTPDGQPLTGFGNNGEVLFNDNFNIVKIDSSNRIIYAKIASTNPAEIGRINSDGTQDTTFSYNGTLGLEFWDIFEKNGYYYIGGFADFNNSPAYYITKLNQNGTVDPVFGEYIESDPNLLYHYVNAIKVFDNSIIVRGDGSTTEIVKYLLNGNATLFTVETAKNNSEITFENPVKQNLVYRSKEKIFKIDIYSVDGKLLKTIKENNSDVSELLKAVYFAKTTFENGKVSTQKFIKN